MNNETHSQKQQTHREESALSGSTIWQNGYLTRRGLIRKCIDCMIGVAGADALLGYSGIEIPGATKISKEKLLESLNGVDLPTDLKEKVVTATIETTAKSPDQFPCNCVCGANCVCLCKCTCSCNCGGPCDCPCECMCKCDCHCQRGCTCSCGCDCHAPDLLITATNNSVKDTVFDTATVNDLKAVMPADETNSGTSWHGTGDGASNDAIMGTFGLDSSSDLDIAMDSALTPNAAVNVFNTLEPNHEAAFEPNFNSLERQ